MTIDEFNQKLREDTAKIPDTVLVTTQQLVNLIRNRVINTGQDENKNRFSAYTEAYLKKKRKREPNASFKNFYATGEMWKSFKIQDREDTEGQTVVICHMDTGARQGASSQDLAEIHSGREGTEIIAPTDQEIQTSLKTWDKLLDRLYE